MNSYNNGYFHPNDIDASVPTPKELGMIRNWLNTVGSSTALYKIDNLLTNNHFQSIEAAWSKLKQSPLKVINIPRLADSGL